MSAEGVNVPLLRKAVEWAEAEAMKPPELCEWDQGVYRDLEPQRRYVKARAKGCGTCYCVAGYVVAMHDARYALGEYVGDPAEIAADLLHIDRDAASELGGLFYDDNTIEDVRRIAEDIAGERL